MAGGSNPAQPVLLVEGWEENGTDTAWRFQPALAQTLRGIKKLVVHFTIRTLLHPRYHTLIARCFWTIVDQHISCAIGHSLFRRYLLSLQGWSVFCINHSFMS